MTLNLARLHEYPVVSVDCETTGLHWYKDTLFGIAVGAYDGKDVHSDYYDIREKPRILEALAVELPHAPLIVNHNIKFDAHFLRENKVRLPADKIECTSVRAAVIDEHEPSFSLDALARKYVGRGKADVWEKLAQLFGGAPTRSAQIQNLHRAPVNLAAEYAAPDTELAILLWLWQEQEIKQQGLKQVWGLERKLTPILIEIEEQGVRVDTARAEQSIKAINTQVARAQRALDTLAGGEVNVNSPVQMRKLFKIERRDEQWYADTGLMLEQTEGGVASVDKDFLRIMAEKDERARHILTIRRMLKAQSFLKDHIIGHAMKGRVYPNYNQTRGETEHGTRTGRLSIDDPALQQIPMHDRDVAEIVRPCFLPEKGQVWACADWKQFEFRWFAHYVNDPIINKLYAEDVDADFHQTTANITGITRDRKFAGDTANAKQINLGLVFGMGEGEMAYNMGMPYTQHKDDDGRMWKTAGDEAKAIFAKYHAAIPGVRKLLQQASSIARARGYVVTKMGRHLRFPGGKFTHKAGGLVFQGTSADCMKLKMIELWPICKKEGWIYLLSVHDEHDLSVPKGKGGELIRKLRSVLENFGSGEPIECRIPILSDISFGDTWWEACQ